MPKPLSARNQPNSRRLWISYGTYNLWGKGQRIPERYQDQYGWRLPNTRRWRKLIRQVLGEAAKSRSIYDLAYDPGAQTVGYAYKYYAVALKAPSGVINVNPTNDPESPRS